MPLRNVVRSSLPLFLCRTILGVTSLTVAAVLCSLLGTDCHCGEKDCAAQLSPPDFFGALFGSSSSSFSTPGDLLGNNGVALDYNDSYAAESVRSASLSTLSCPEEGFFRFGNSGLFLEFDESEIAYNNLGGVTLQKTDPTFVSTNAFLQSGGDPSFPPAEEGAVGLPQGIYYKGVGRDVQPTDW